MEFNQKEIFVTIQGQVGAIDACIHGPNVDGELFSKQLIAVVCHPHPQHGGTMDNKVVTTLVRTYRDLGVAVVRFNFRGVGKSEGHYDGGQGEVADVLSVVDFVRVEFPAYKLLLAGFSFGSAMAAQASFSISSCAHLLLVAPPVERYTYDKDGRFDCPVIVVQGAKDELVHAQGVFEWQAELSSSSRILAYDDAGHFFHGYLTELKQDLSELLLLDLK